jgi:hypothetical protein
MPVSFSRTIMKVHGVHPDDFQYMSDATNNYANAQPVERPRLYHKWRTDGYQP